MAPPPLAPPTLPVPSEAAVAAALAAMEAVFEHVPRPVHGRACRCCAGRVELPRLLGTPRDALSGDDLLPYALKAMTTVGDTAELVWFTPRLLTLQLADALGVDDELLLGKLGLGDLAGWADSLRVAVCAVLGAELGRRLAVAPEAVDAWLCGLALATGDLAPWLHAVDAGPLPLRGAARRFRAWARREGAVGRSAYWREAPRAKAAAEAWVDNLHPEVLIAEDGYFEVTAGPDDGLTLAVDRERGGGVLETRVRRLSDAEAADVWAGDASVARALADAFWW